MCNSTQINKDVTNFKLLKYEIYPPQSKIPNSQCNDLNIFIVKFVSNMLKIQCSYNYWTNTVHLV